MGCGLSDGFLSDACLTMMGSSNVGLMELGMAAMFEVVVETVLVIVLAAFAAASRIGWVLMFTLGTLTL